jgi:hypothetical protein
MNNTIPLDPTYVPASAVVELGRGKIPQCLAVQEQLATVDGSATGGTGSDYLNNLRFRRQLVSNLLIKDKRYFTLSQTFAECVRYMCTNVLLDLLGTPTDALDMSVTLLKTLGQGDAENLFQAYMTFVTPVSVPEFGPGSQPQDLMLWYKTAFLTRMQLADCIGMDPAIITFLMLTKEFPRGTGDMARPLSDFRASCAAMLSSDEPKTSEVIVAFLEAQRDSWGRRHWAGSLKSPPQKDGQGDGLSAYSADAAPASSSGSAPGVDAEEPRPIDNKAAGVCEKWQTRGCDKDPCKYSHPNGKRRCDGADAICYSWMFHPDGCSRQQCLFKHPNGKSKKDRSTGEGAFNKRDLTPVGQRHTPVDKGDPVKVDPKAAEAHERNRQRRLKYRQTDSD